MAWVGEWRINWEKKRPPAASGHSSLMSNNMHTYYGCVVCGRKVSVCHSAWVCPTPHPCHRHMVAATIGPCSGNILLTFGSSCPCHLETKTNGLTSPSIACKTSTIPDRVLFFLLAFSYILRAHINALYGRKSIVWKPVFSSGMVTKKTMHLRFLMSQFLQEMCVGAEMLTCVVSHSACAKPVHGQRSLRPPAAPLIGVGRRRAPSSAFRAIRDPRSAGALKRMGAYATRRKDEQRHERKD